MDVKGTLTVAGNTVLHAGNSTALATKTYTWVVPYPTTGGIGGPRLNVPHTAVRIDSFVVGGTSCSFNIEERSTIGSAGSDLLASDQVATTSGASTTSFADSSLAANNWLWLDISAVSGAVTQLVVTLTCTV